MQPASLSSSSCSNISPSLAHIATTTCSGPDLTLTLSRGSQASSHVQPVILMLMLNRHAVIDMVAALLRRLLLSAAKKAPELSVSLFVGVTPMASAARMGPSHA